MMVLATLKLMFFLTPMVWIDGGERILSLFQYLTDSCKAGGDIHASVMPHKKLR